MFRAEIRKRTDALVGIMPFLVSDRAALVMTLGGYFDESERELADDPIGVGGYVFKPTAYKQFCRQWRRMLQNAPGGRVSCIHMTDLYAGKKDYAGRDIRQRADLLKTAVGLITEHAMCGVVVVFNQSEFERVAPPKWPDVAGSIYSTACQMTMTATAQWMNDNKIHLPIHYVFETGHYFEHEADNLLMLLRHIPQARIEVRYHGHSFVDKMDACGLQAADVLAWMGTKLVSGARTSRAAQPFADALSGLFKHRQRYFMHHFTGHKLIDFFDVVLRGIERGMEQGGSGGFQPSGLMGPHKKKLRSK